MLQLLDARAPRDGVWILQPWPFRKTLATLLASFSILAEGGGPSDSRVCPILRQNHGHLCKALIHAPILQLFLDACEKSAHELSQASAKNKHVGLKQIDDVSGPNRQEVSSLLQHLGG